MTSASGRPPRGRRDNGLDASEYAAAADVDPRVGEHLLDVLALAGIAAYLQPSADLHPVTRTTTLPNRPTDRLWVDRRHLDDARDVIRRLDLGTGPSAPTADDSAQTGSAELPPPPHAGLGAGPDSPARRRRRDDFDIDTAWQQILESWDSPPVEPSAGGRPTGRTVRPADPADGAPGNGGAWPGDPGDPDEHDDPGTPEHDRRARPRATGPEPIVGLDVPFDRHEVVRDPDDEGFVPPAPPPLPRVSRYTLLAAVLVLAGLALFFRPSLLPAPESTALVVGMGLILGGFGTLVWRLRDDLTDDDDPDDGAIV
jgi:hypothetical protein